MDLPMQDATGAAGNSNRSGHAGKSSDNVDAETALLAVEKLEVEMKSLLKRANVMADGSNRVGKNEADDMRVRMEMLEKIHLLASIISAFVSSPDAQEHRNTNDKAGKTRDAAKTTSRATRSKQRRVRESIRNIELLIKEAEEKLERWEKMLIDVYKEADGVSAPPPQQEQA